MNGFFLSDLDQSADETGRQEKERSWPGQDSDPAAAGAAPGQRSFDWRATGSIRTVERGPYLASGQSGGTASSSTSSLTLW